MLGSILSGRDSDDDWRRFGECEPYFAVLTDPKFRKDNLDESAREAFFRSGEASVDQLLGEIRAGLVPAFSPKRVLEFGCGVGRLLIPMARIADEVVGVDVSAAMRAEAARNCEARGATGVELVDSDDALSQARGKFDLVYSFIVLQHIPPRRGEVIIRNLLARVNPGGVAALHVTCRSPKPLGARLESWARRRIPFAHEIGNLVERRALRWPLMQMNEYDLNRVLLIVHEAGMENVRLHFTRHGRDFGVVVLGVKAGGATW